jgi:hypothetical protein
MIVSIVTETVSYAHAQGYTDFSLSPEEFMLYLAILIGFGIHGLPSVRYIWSRNRYLRIEGLAKLMTRNRFLEIHRSLHLPPADQMNNSFYKVTRFLWALRRNCEANFIPFQDIGIDEATPRSQHRTRNKSRTKHKNIPSGIDIKCLVCSISVYVFSFSFFKFSELVLAGCSRTTACVYFLCSKLPFGGFRAWMDNFYSTPTLAKLLWDHFGHYVSGTWRANFGVPDILKSDRLAKGEASFTICKGDDFKILGIKIHDNKIFYFLTSWPEPVVFVVGGLKQKLRLQIIHEYNQKMNSVDRFDQRTKNYSTYVKSRKWWRVGWSWGLDVGLHDGHVCYNAFHPITRINYHLSVIDEIVTKYWTPPQDVPKKTPGERFDQFIPERFRLQGRTHWPDYTKKNKKQRRFQKRCVVCHKNGIRKDVTTVCKKCNVGLCLGKCYKRWHTMKDY